MAYDWRSGTSPSFYKKVNAEPSGWDYVDFSSTLEDGTSHQFGIWVPIAVPMIGSRDLQAGDNGDDVKALQRTLNLIRTNDDTDPYYYDVIPVSGTYDQSTADAVYTLQDYYGLAQNGIADFNFQASLYEQAVTLGN